MAYPIHVSTPQPGQKLSFDDVLETLRSRSRRKLLVNLMKSNPREESKQPEELDLEGDADQLRTQLRHVDLPKLAGMKLIEWNRETGRIVKGPRFDEVGPLLQLLNRHQDELPDDCL